MLKLCVHCKYSNRQAIFEDSISIDCLKYRNPIDECLVGVIEGVLIDTETVGNTFVLANTQIAKNNRTAAIAIQRAESCNLLQGVNGDYPPSSISRNA